MGTSVELCALEVGVGNVKLRIPHPAGGNEFFIRPGWDEPGVQVERGQAAWWFPFMSQALLFVCHQTKSDVLAILFFGKRLDELDPAPEVAGEWLTANPRMKLVPLG